MSKVSQPNLAPSRWGKVRTVHDRRLSRINRAVGAAIRSARAQRGPFPATLTPGAPTPIIRRPPAWSTASVTVEGPWAFLVVAYFAVTEKSARDPGPAQAEGGDGAAAQGPR